MFLNHLMEEKNIESYEKNNKYCKELGSQSIKNFFQESSMTSKLVTGY